MCGWVGRILYPDSCMSVSYWSKVPLLSTWFVAEHFCRALLPCPSRWHGSLPRRGLWWLTCELHCSPLPWRLGSVYWLWKSPLLSCVPWSSDQSSCLSSHCMSWSSSCKAHNRSIRPSTHPWPCPSDEPQRNPSFGLLLSCIKPTPQSEGFVQWCCPSVCLLPEMWPQQSVSHISSPVINSPMKFTLAAGPFLWHPWMHDTCLVWWHVHVMSGLSSLRLMA